MYSKVDHAEDETVIPQQLWERMPTASWQSSPAGKKRRQLNLCNNGMEPLRQCEKIHVSLSPTTNLAPKGLLQIPVVMTFDEWRRTLFYGNPCVFVQFVQISASVSYLPCCFFLFAGKLTQEVSNFHVMSILKLPSEKELRVATVNGMDCPIPLIQLPSS